MAKRKAGGTAKSLRDSNAKYLGVKLSDGSIVKPGQVIVRQRGTRIMPGKNVSLGRDHTIFSLANGIVKFTKKRKQDFNGKINRRSFVSVDK